MNSNKKFFIFSLFLIVVILGSLYLKPTSSITGNVPLTGVLKEDTSQSMYFPEFNISFSMEDEKIYKIRDISYVLHIVPSSDFKTVIKVDYVVSNSSDVVFFYEEYITVSGETKIIGDLDKREAQGIELLEGEYNFLVIVSYLDYEKTFSKSFYVEEISEFLYSLKQLFDIKMEIDDKILDSSEELEARVVFTSFGSEPTPVNLTFFIYDYRGNEIFKKNVEKIIETEGVYTEDFLGFSVPAGEYTVVLRTVYNVDVEDYFEDKVIIRKKTDWLPFIVAFGIIIAGIIVFLISRKR